VIIAALRLFEDLDVGHQCNDDVRYWDDDDCPRLQNPASENVAAMVAA